MNWAVLLVRDFFFSLLMFASLFLTFISYFSLTHHPPKIWNSVLPVLSLQFTKRVLCWVPGPPLSSSYWTDRHVALCSLVDCMMIWSPCGTVLTGGMHNDLTTMWYCVDWWTARWSDRHVLLCRLVDCTIIWPPCGTVLTGGMHDDLTTMWYCAD